MARKQSKAVQSDKPKWSFKGFINYTFSSQEISRMLMYFDERTFDHSETIMTWCDEGFKISVSFDEYQNAYLFSATAKRTNTDLDGWIVQFRHNDMHRLLCAAGFAVNELWPNGAIKPIEEGEQEYGW